jgi:GAF domain-containing protein
MPAGSLFDARRGRTIGVLSLPADFPVSAGRWFDGHAVRHPGDPAGDSEHEDLKPALIGRRPGRSKRQPFSGIWGSISMIVSVQRLARVCVEVADTLHDEFDAAEFLSMLTVRVADLVDASAVGILLADDKDQLQFMAASDESAKAVEIFQAQTHEGPCEQAYRSGQSVINADLRTSGERWPRFAAQATAAGFEMVHGFPLRRRNQAIGALNVFNHHADAHLDDGDIQIIQALADLATIALLQQRTISRGATLAEQLQHALNSRIVIEQAKGAIAHARSISVEGAFGILRRHARSHNQRLTVLAHAVVRDISVLDEPADRS